MCWTCYTTPGIYLILGGEENTARVFGHRSHGTEDGRKHGKGLTARNSGGSQTGLPRIIHQVGKGYFRREEPSQTDPPSDSWLGGVVVDLDIRTMRR